MLFLVSRDRHTQRTLLRDIHDRLVKQAGCSAVRYRPSRRRPRAVCADVDTAAFLGDSYAVETARLELRFWYPTDASGIYYRINWVEPEREFVVGFHRDDDHPELGPCHIQLGHREHTIGRQELPALDAHPLAILDERLQQLPSVLDAVRWQNDSPSLDAELL